MPVGYLAEAFLVYCFSVTDRWLPLEKRAFLAEFDSMENTDVTLDAAKIQQFLDPKNSNEVSLTPTRLRHVAFLCSMTLSMALLNWGLSLFTQGLLLVPTVRFFMVLAYLLNIRFEVVSYRNVNLFGTLAYISWGTFMLFRGNPVGNLPFLLRYFETPMTVFPTAALFLMGRRWSIFMLLFVSVVMCVGFFHSLGPRTIEISFKYHLNFVIAILSYQIQPIMFFLFLHQESVKYQQMLLKVMRSIQDKSLAKTFFISRMSHELRTPLQGLLSSANLLKQTPISEEQGMYLSTIDSCGMLLLDVVVKILDISKIESGRFDSVNQRFSLTEMVSMVLDSVAALADSKKLEIVAQFDPHHGGYDIEGDQIHFTEIVTNLVGNAVKFTDSGAISLTVSRKAPLLYHPEKPIYRLTIQDSGKGIPAKFLPVLFNPFTQGQQDQRKADGSGLGLSLVKMFTEALGGSVSVSSVENQGSTFTIDVPFTPLPPGTISTAIDTLPVSPAVLRKANIGVIYSSKTIKNSLVFHLSSWVVPFRIVCSATNWSDESSAALRSFLARRSSESVACFVVDGDVELLLKVIADINSELGTTRGEAFAEVRILFICFLSYYSQAMREIQIHGVSSWVTVLAKPLTSSKLSKALSQMIKGTPTHLSGSMKSLFPESNPDQQRLSAEYGVAIPVVWTTSNGTEHQAGGRALATNHASLGLPVQSPSHILDVLIVEDNRINQMVLSKQLQKLGATHRIVASGAAALQAWDEQQGAIALIFMDVEIEGELNGLQITSLIRQREQSLPMKPRSFIAVMTGRALDKDKKEAYNSGCDDFLIKPVSMDKIRELVTKQLNLRSSL